MSKRLNSDVWLQTETLYYGDRKISIRTSVLEEKATACNMLCCYADELEVGFFPYVEQVGSHMLHSAAPPQFISFTTTGESCADKEMPVSPAYKPCSMASRTTSLSIVLCCDGDRSCICLLLYPSSVQKAMSSI